ncbi:DUF1653 domain-containing protein [Oxalobacteraceae bacterium R-40]|uniref:DUF1653 domain-containing protein n=1 Tax=Keguizhuia sedimenti TaxID=3064264 RepID=A0ABU1BKM9_9BURK|nr:DUF1653 domain-containing protein [Oxalobacteraceae bacterium R-40]
MRYRHYKGGIYEYICTARLESDPETKMVIYRAADNSIWARKQENFFEIIEINGKPVQRFELIE